MRRAAQDGIERCLAAQEIQEAGPAIRIEHCVQLPASRIAVHQDGAIARFRE